MRTGLITFHFAHHYGAQLQAYATMRSIQALGAQCEIIDYRLPHTTRTNQLFKRSGALRALVRRCWDEAERRKLAMNILSVAGACVFGLMAVGVFWLAVEMDNSALQASKSSCSIKP